MLSAKSIRDISDLFCGNQGDCFSYKTGSNLVSFFNKEMKCNDSYGTGFPSRWIYVADKITELLHQKRFDFFLNILLSTKFIMNDLDCKEIEAIKHSEKILDEFNKIVKRDLCQIIKLNKNYTLIQIDEDLEQIGEGGFAFVYKQKSTGLIVKKLKREFLTNPGIISRFKREFMITQSLSDINGIVKVYDFNDEDCSYTMEDAGTRLDIFVLKSPIQTEVKFCIIENILFIMLQIHEKGVIHRDISPNNIFISNSGIVKIADFGLGKDYASPASHQTVDTHNFGQVAYCAPEQIEKLKDATQKSDIFSLGKLINFILTENPQNYEHELKNICETATNINTDKRYADAGKLFMEFKDYKTYIQNKENEKAIMSEIQHGKLTTKIEHFLASQNGNQLCQLLIDNKQFKNILILYMNKFEKQAYYIVGIINDNYKYICGRSFSAYDPIADLSYMVLINDFSFDVKKLALEMLIYVAYSVNRFQAQDLTKKLLTCEQLDFCLGKILSENSN